MIIEILQYNTIVNVQPSGGNVVDIVPDNKPEIINIEVVQGSGSGGSGTVTSITASSPLTGGTITTSGMIGIPQANTSTDGYLSSSDWNSFNDKQPELVSGTNIKTINSTSLLGSGNLVVGGTVDSVNGQTGVVILNASDVGADVSGAAATAQTNAEAYTDTQIATRVPTTRNIATTAPLTGGGTLAADKTLAITKSDASTDGYLSSADWNTFNGKGSGSVSSVGLVPGTTGSDVNVSGSPITGSGNITLNIPTASASNRGALSSADWTTFNNKQSTITTGNLTDAGTDGIVVTGGSGSVIGSGTSLAQHVADTTHNGYLNSTDWNTFNNKQTALTIGNFTDAGTDGIVVTNGAGSVIGSGTSIAQHVADASHNGYLSSGDWSIFNGKQAALSIGNLTDVGTDGIIVTGGSGSVIGSGTSIAQHVADTTHNGYLNSTDWNTFNNKQAAGSYLTTVTADSPLSGSGTSGSHLVIADAAADGSTKGAASFTANDFNSSGGNISIDYTNGQAADTTHKGFLTSTDWNTFNGKGAGSVTSVGVTSTDLSVAGSPVTTSGNITLNINSSVSLGGNPTTTTQSSSDNSTKIATTAFVTTAVNNAISGVNPAVAVQAATTSAANTSGLTYSNGVSGIGATFTGSVNTALTFDGFTFTAVGQRALIKNDTQSPSGAFNGVYYVTQLQAIGLPPILTRALDYDQPSDINNTGAIPVINGTVNANTSWLLTSTVTTVGTDALTYVQFSYAPSTIITTSTSAGGDLTGTYPNPTIKSGVGLTGNPTAPTPSVGDNSTSIATTAFVFANSDRINNPLMVQIFS